MSPRTASAVASPNIALIKYWGNRDDTLRLPANSSISMTLGGLETRTAVEFDPGLDDDTLTLNGTPAPPDSHERVRRHLDLIRHLAGLHERAHVVSQANFPTGAGIASSAAAYAALTLAACTASGLDLGPRELSRLARRGSGSAARSVFGGFVEWHAADGDEESFAEPLVPPDHWRLIDLIAIVSWEAKNVGSTPGHALARTSPLQEARLADAPRRLAECRQAIVARDFDRLATVAEQDSNLMHAVMQTSVPPLLYWEPRTLTVMQSVSSWRSLGLSVFYTIDAGPNVHCLCPAEIASEIASRLHGLSGVLDVLSCPPGEAARRL
jgi:diphosphomevalonate decarboxylase